MHYKRLETFLLVATLGSFRKVAQRLYTTQPAISNRIAALENELGCRLFEREQGLGGVQLTSKGKELLPFAEKIVSLSNQLRQRADTEQQHSGLLRLGVSETIVHSWLPTFMSSIHEEMPNLDIELTVDVTSNLGTALVDRSIDLAFLMGPVGQPEIVDIDLCNFPLQWVASKHLGLPSRRLKLHELQTTPVLTFAKNTKPFSDINNRFKEVGTTPTRFFSSSSLAALVKMTVDGVGISALPAAVVANEISRGDLIELDVEWAPNELRFTASYCTVPANFLVQFACARAVVIAQSYSEARP